MASPKDTLHLPDILIPLTWEENDDLEFKSAKGGLPKSLWETYSGMANTSGGIILLGVENNGSVSGVKDILAIKRDFWNTVNNHGKVSANLLENDDIQEISHPNGPILAIRILRASRYQRPIFINQNPLLGTYRRNAEGDYHCTVQEVRRMFADCEEETADSRILEHYGIEDLDLTSLQQYRQRFASFKPTHPWLSGNDEELLSKLGGWRICRTTHKRGITMAGFLMFGREETLREAIPQYHVDYREKLSDNPEIRWTDRLTMDGTWPGNLFQFYIRVIQRLAADLKLPFQLDNDLLRKGETIVHIAIREALVNALIHADYQGEGGIVIEKYKDRFEFSNPGSLLISFDQLLRGNVSECRNKSLQTMFTMIGAAEKAGSGVDKIRIGWNSQHWRLPIVKEHTQPDRVLWKLPMVSLIPNESLARLKKRFGDKFSTFNQTEIQALVTCDIEDSVDNARMRQITGCHATDITLLFQGLVSKKALIQEGHGRWTRYSLPYEFDSVHIEDNSVHIEDNSVHIKDNSVHIEELSTEKWKKLLEIAKPARENRRLPPAEMEKVIFTLLKDSWLTRAQLGTLLDRNSDGLRTRFLTHMVRHNFLQLRYPDRPNRRDQTYSALSISTKVD